MTDVNMDTQDKPPPRPHPALQALDVRVGTWEVDEQTFTNWFRDIGAANRNKDRFSEDRNTLTGQWEWPGGGYEAIMTRN